MRSYATVTSERASKGQGGNKYLEFSMQNENQEKLFFLKSVVVSGGIAILTPMGKPYVVKTGGGGYEITAGEFMELWKEATEKGEKQKGEYHKCKKHEERTRECKFYSFQNDPCSEI